MPHNCIYILKLFSVYFLGIFFLKQESEMWCVHVHSPSRTSFCSHESLCYASTRFVCLVTDVLLHYSLWKSHSISRAFVIISFQLLPHISSNVFSSGLWVTLTYKMWISAPASSLLQSIIQSTLTSIPAAWHSFHHVSCCFRLWIADFCYHFECLPEEFLLILSDQSNVFHAMSSAWFVADCQFNLF